MAGHTPMRVLQVHARYRLEGGEEVVVARERALLEAAGHEVVLHERANASLATRSRRRQAASTVWSTLAAREVAAAARRHKADVVHVHNTFPVLSPAVFGAARSTGAAVIATLHNHRFTCLNGLLLRDGVTCTACVGRSFAAPGVRHACAEGDRARSVVVATMQSVARVRGVWTSNVDVVITPTRFGCDVATRAGIPAALLVVRPHGVPAPLEPVSAPGSREGVLFVGRLSPEKGPDLLVDAWHLLGAAAPPLSIVGDGPMHDTLAARIARLGLGNVRLCTGVGAAQLARLRARARVSVSPSRAVESFGLTIAEAAAAGVPSVVSGHGALASLVDDGRTGWHVAPGNARALADTIAAAHGDAGEAARRGAAAHARWQLEWTESAATTSLEAVYDVALRHRARHLARR